MKKARNEGRTEGRTEGRNERDLEIAKSMLLKGFAPEVVAGIIGLPLEQIKLL
jgi:predicted transposase/invertase (TIGR01784 family)